MVNIVPTPTPRGVWVFVMPVGKKGFIAFCQFVSVRLSGVNRFGVLIVCVLFIVCSVAATVTRPLPFRWLGVRCAVCCGCVLNKGSSRDRVVYKARELRHHLTWAPISCRTSLTRMSNLFCHLLHLDSDSLLLN